MAVSAWWRANETEVRASSALRLAGASLALSYVLSAVYWHASPRYLAVAKDAICWPFFEACADVRNVSPTFYQAWLLLLALLGCATMASFSRPAWTSRALALLGATALVKAAYLIQDYRLMGNYHYMPFVLTTAYLLAPRKRSLWAFLLVGFYLSAGALKLDREWLSGAALLRPAALSGKWLELGCAYVVVLELCFVLGLLTRHRPARWAVLAQLCAFHAFSFHIVGWFYPAVMACLLAPLPLFWREDAHEPLREDPREPLREDTREPSPLEVLFTGRAGRSTYACLGLYAAAQLLPLVFPGDSALNGEGRLFALNMLDARSVCDAATFVRRGHDTIEQNGNHPELAIRIHCDPLVYWNETRRLCRETPRPDRVDTFLIGRRTSANASSHVLAVTDFCTRDPGYDVWRPNAWLLGP